MTLFQGDGRPSRHGPDVTVCFDGGSRGNPGPAAIGALVVDASVEPPRVLATVSEAIGVATSNVAEYRAAIAGLEAADALGARGVVVRGDSKLVIEQLAGRWKVRQAHLQPLHARARQLLRGFEVVALEHVRRERNSDADALVNAALDALGSDTAVIVWYVGLSVFAVATIFRSAGIDYRLVAVGALLPLLVDLPLGYRVYGHTLLFAVTLLALVMLGTIGRPRLLRRRLLCVPIGVFCGLVLSGAFTNNELFWWPFLGTSFPHESLLPAAWVVAVEEVIGLVVCWVLVGQYDLYLPGPRREFFRTGRLRTAD